MDTRLKCDAYIQLSHTLDKIKNNSIIISQKLKINSIFLSHLFRNNVLNERDVECVSHNTPTNIIQFLMILRRKGVKGFECFLEALKLSEQNELLNILQE